MIRLFEMFDQIEPLEPGLREYLMKVLKRRLIKKKEFLLKPGQVSRHIYFIETGLMRGFRIVDGKEVSKAHDKKWRLAQSAIWKLQA